MSSYYAANPHYAPDDFSEARECLERCEAEAGWYFARATVTQHAEFQRAMSDIRELGFYDGQMGRDAANAAFRATTADAAALCDETVKELMLTGEMSDDLSYRWDQLIVAALMSDAA